MAISTKIDQVTDRVERLLLRHEELQRTNILLTEQLNLLNRYLEPVMKDTRNLKDARPARAA